MTSPPSAPEPADPPAPSDSTRYPGIPAWVKVSGIILLVIVAVLVVVMVAAGGQHGPMRHMSPGDPGVGSPLAGLQQT